MSDFRFGFSCGFDRIEDAVKAGADYIELNFGNIYKFSTEDISAHKEISKKLHIQFEAANCMMPGSIKVVGDNVDYAAISDYLETASEKAENLGLKFVVFGSSGSRNIPDGFSRDRAFEQLVKFMKEYVTPVFKKHGLTCAIENLSFGESNVLNLIDESYSLAKAVSSEQVKLLVDFYHFGYNHDSFDSIRKAKDLIAHIHVASVLNDRCFPLLNDSDEAAYKAELDLLREIGYDKREGRVTFEASLPKDKSFAECAVESIKVFKNL